MSVNPKNLVSTIYNPHNQSEDELLNAFVVRLKTFEKLKRDLEASTMKSPEQHYIIQGVRGMGKTTLLRRIEIEVKQNEKLNSWLLPIIFNEEEYGVSSLADVWEKLAEYLELADETFDGLVESITPHYQNDNYERTAFELISTALKKQKKKVLLLIDNIGDILKKFSETEEQRFREVLLTSCDIRLFGATSIYLEQLNDYKKPLFDFFKYLHLDGLSKTECQDLMRKLGEAYQEEEIERILKEQPERIEILRRLTGGVIRTSVLLFEIFVEKNSTDAFRDLEIIVDRVTPLYKHRMDDLKPQQQKIVAALCEAWEAATTKEIAEAVRMESKIVSAQLIYLVKNRIVNKIETDTKNHLYAIDERFFNIWYLMRFGKRTDKRIYWYVKFLEAFIGGKDNLIKDKVQQLVNRMVQSKDIDPKMALYLTEAYSHLIGGDEQENLKNVAKEFLEPYGKSYTREISKSDNEIRANTFKTYDITEDDLRERTRELSQIKKIEIPDICEMDIINFALKNGSLYLGQEDVKDLSNDIKIIVMSFSLKTLVLSKRNKNLCLILVENISLDDYENISERRKSAYLVNLLCLMIEVYLWNNKIESAKRLFISFSYLLKENINGEKTDSMIKLFIAKNQYFFIGRAMRSLLGRRTPLYYANLHYIKDEYPTEYLRMPAEMKETVEELIAEIDQMAIDYA